MTERHPARRAIFRMVTDRPITIPPMDIPAGTDELARHLLYTHARASVAETRLIPLDHLHLEMDSDGATLINRITESVVADIDITEIKSAVRLPRQAGQTEG